MREILIGTENAPFHTELHKLRKTGATRLAVGGMPLHILQKLLGHKSLSTTQKYLADVNLTSGKMNDIIEEAAYMPKPRIVKKTGTDGSPPWVLMSLGGEVRLPVRRWGRTVDY